MPTWAIDRDDRVHIIHGCSGMIFTNLLPLQTTEKMTSHRLGLLDAAIAWYHCGIIATDGPT